MRAMLHGAGDRLRGGGIPSAAQTQHERPEKLTMKKTLTKADIVEAIYEETDKNRVDVKNVVEKLLDIMKTAIKKDRALLISGFGKFECYDKASRKGRNPQTDETITLPPRKVMVFRLSRKFRSELNP